ncbi:MAG: hypothetical protein U1D30_15165 [Planctomycetota bacterium]
MAGRAELGKNWVSLRWANSLPVLTLLLTLTLVPRVIAIARSVAPARDARRYWTAADLFSHQPFTQVLRSIDAHPLYPYSLHLLKRCLRAIGVEVGPQGWFVACQWWSTLTYLVFIACFFEIGTRFWSRPIAFGGCLAVAWLPRQVEYSIDVLSDSLHAACFSLGFLAVVLAMDQSFAADAKHGRKSIVLFALGGALAGLAYWTRPEGLLLVAIVLSVFVTRQFRSDWRIPWGNWGSCLIAFLLPVALLIGGYVTMLGQLSPKNSAKALVGGVTQAEPGPWIGNALLGRELSPRSSAELEWVRLVSRTWPQVALRALVEVGKEARGWLLVLFLFALVDRRRTRVYMPRRWFVIYSLLGALAMLLLLGRMVGFVAGRYVMSVLPLFGMVAISGGEAFVARIRDLPRFLWEKRWSVETLELRRKLVTSGILAAVALSLCVPRWFQRLHPHRTCHREAANWLRRHAGGGEAVFDPSWTTSFFAGLPRCSGDSDSFRYAVIDSDALARVDAQARGVLERIDRSGRVVARFERTKGENKGKVLIVEVPRLARANEGGEERQ